MLVELPAKASVRYFEVPLNFFSRIESALPETASYEQRLAAASFLACRTAVVCRGLDCDRL